MKHSIFILFCLSLAGCATQNSWHWEKEYASQQDFNMDTGQCRVQALSSTGGVLTFGTAMIMDSCMQGKGWVQVHN